jgi:hypothetical protein
LRTCVMRMIQFSRAVAEKGKKRCTSYFIPNVKDQ